MHCNILTWKQKKWVKKSIILVNSLEESDSNFSEEEKNESKNEVSNEEDLDVNLDDFVFSSLNSVSTDYIC